MSNLISARELDSRLGAPELRIIDVRASLTDPQAGDVHLSLLFDGRRVYFRTVGAQEVELNDILTTMGELSPAGELRI